MAISTIHLICLDEAKVISIYLVKNPNKLNDYNAK